jgi:hypothetical protein
MDDPTSSSTWWLSADRNWHHGTPPPGWWQAHDRRWHPPTDTMPITSVAAVAVAAPAPSHHAHQLAAHDQPNAVTAGSQHPQGTNRNPASPVWERLASRIRRNSTPPAPSAFLPARAPDRSHRDQWTGTGTDGPQQPGIPDTGSTAARGAKHAKQRSSPARRWMSRRGGPAHRSSSAIHRRSYLHPVPGRVDR